MARALRGIKKPHPLGSVPTRSGVSQLTAESGVSSVTLPGVKISALPAAGAALVGDQFEVNQGGVSRRITADQLLTLAAEGSGTVTSTSVVNANGFDGTVATPTTTPAITMKTTVTGMLKGNGTAISAAVSGTDYAPAVAGGYLPLTGGTLTGALLGTSATMSGSITSTGGTISATGGPLMVDRTGDAVTAQILARSDAGQYAVTYYQTGTGTRWFIGKNNTAEAGSNAGSDFVISPYADDGTTSLGSAFLITRSTKAVALSGALTGTTATMSGTITSTGGNITASGGIMQVDRTGDAAAATLAVISDAAFVAGLNFQTAATARWIVRKNATAEGGSNAGSDFEIAARNDAGGALSTPVTITRSTGAVALTGALSGMTATMSGNIITNGGYVMVDRRTDAAPGEVFIRTDVGQTGTIYFETSNTSRWALFKNATAEGGSNAGSDFHIWAYADAGTSIGSALSITRSTRNVAINQSTTTHSATAIPAGGTLGAGYMMSSTANFGINFGSGVPDKAMAKGSVYLRSDGTGAPYYNADGTGAGWTQIGSGSGGGVTVSATEPSSPVDGSMWFNTDASVGGGNLYVRYNDGTSVAWVPASTATAGSVVQTVSFQTGAVATGTTTIPGDDTIPQITEGNEYMTLAITPRSTTSKLVIEVTAHLMTSSAAGGTMAAALFQDSTVNALACGYATAPTSAASLLLSFKHVMTSGTTSATTFRVRGGFAAAGTTTFNGYGGGRLYGGVLASSIVIQEVL